MPDFIELESSSPEPHFSAATMPLVLLAAGLLITAALCWWGSQRNQQSTHEAMVASVQRAVEVIQSRLQRYEYGLRGARGAVLTGGEHTITRQQFKRYSDSRNLTDEFPGALGFGFIRRVPQTEEAAFLNAARRDGMPDFSIRQLSPHEGERYVIQYIEPVEQNRIAVGLDIASEPNRKVAAENSMRSGEPKLTAPITLVQSTGMPNQSFLFLMPIYHTGKTPEAEAARISSMYGWSYAALNMLNVLGDSGINPQQAQLELQDQTMQTHPISFYTTSGSGETALAIDSYSTNQAFYGRTWGLRLSIYPAFVDALPLLPVSTLALSGVVTSLLLAILTFFWRNARRRRRQLLAAQLQLAAIVESSIDGIIGKTLAGVVVSWNKGAEQLFGYTAHDAVGLSLASLIVPEDVRDEETYILTCIGKGQKVDHFQTRRQHKDGHLIDVSVSVSPVYSLDGSIIGASKTVRDISKEKAAEAEVLAVNASLEGLVQSRTVELENAQRALRTVLDGVPSMIGYWDVQLINRVANHAYQIWFGVDPVTLPGRSMQDVLGERLFQANRCYIDGVLRGEPQTFERAIPGPDGKIRQSLTHYVPDVSQGEVEGFFVIAHDVTELTESRLRLAGALRENELLLQAINEQLLYSATDANGLIVEANTRFCDVHGFTLEDLLGQDHRLLHSGIHPKPFWQLMWAQLQGGEAWHGEICNRARDGSLHWFDTVVAPSFGSDGAIERYIALRIDITRRRAADEEISRLHLLLSSVLQAASEVSIIATDMDGLITVFNTGAQRMLGYQEDEVVGVLTPAKFHLAQEIVARGRVLSEEFDRPIDGFRIFVHVPEIKGSETREWTYTRKDGARLTVALVVTAMRDWTGMITGYLGIATDITEQQRQRRELAAARDQLVLAAEAAQLGIWSWLLSENVMDWNDRMFSLYDLPGSLNGDGRIYDHWRSRVHPEDIAATEASLVAAIDGSGKYDPVFRVLRPDGSIRYVQAGAYVERNSEGVATRITGINLDITERKEVEAELLRAKEHAEQASLVKGQFLANMSHEIRTPMNAVLGMLQLLRQAGLNARQDDYATKAQTAARSLLGLLNDILDFSKIDVGKLVLDLHPFSLEILMRDLAVVLSGNLGEKDVELLFELAPQLPSILIGDQHRLQQILINLAGNATKFTPQGHVVVQLAELARYPGLISLRISVRDTGIGISPAQLTRIFEGFTQAEASTTRRFGGTGLGLAISKRLVELMGGELHIDSEPGKGSEFWFDLTFAVDDATPLTPLQMTSELKPRILVVDDNALSGQILVQTIKAFGWDVDLADGGNAAVQIVKQSMQHDVMFDAVIMDWQMPDLDGVAAARLIKKATGHTKPPVIVMVTAFGREELAEAIDQEDAPFEAFLTKPVTPQQLFAAVRQALGGFEALCAPSPRKPAAPQLQGLRLLVVEDNGLNRQVISELLSAEGAEVTLAESGLEGVKLATRAKGEFDAVIMDVQMPDIDGMEATRRIRSDSRFESLPILAITANASRSDRASCLASGMNEHLGKPIDMAEVVPLLQRLTGRDAEVSISKDESHAFEQDDFIEPLAIILHRLGGLRDIYGMALASFSDEGERLLSELEMLSLTGDTHDIANVLHALRGVAGTVGALALAKQAAALEALARTSPQTDTAQLLPSEMISTLAKLIRDSNERLHRAFDAEDMPESSSKPDVFPWSPAKRNSWLKELLIMLVAGNMRALDLVGDLELHTPDSQRAVTTRLASQIRDLEFDAAVQTAKQLLDGKA